MDNPSSPNYETKFGLELFTKLLQIADSTAQASVKGNVCISPFLVEALLSLMYLGSDGKTAEELKTRLQLERFPNNGKMANYFAGNLAIITQQSLDTQLEICSRIVIHENLEIDTQFKKIAENYYLTLIERLKFADKETVLNSIRNCLQKTINSCTNLNVEQDSAIKPLLLLACNLKSKWFLPFSAYRSGLYDFHVNGNCIKSIPMMLDNEMMVKFVELKDLDARVVELPYEHDDELSMLLILPNKRDGLEELELKLKNINFKVVTEQMQMETVQLLLPKFKIDFECNLKAVLQKMSFSLMFSEESNFKNLLGPKTTNTALPFGDILHKVSIEVHESGSEPSKIEGLAEYAMNLYSWLNELNILLSGSALAKLALQNETDSATKPIVISNSIDTRQKFFRADHPFFFAIRNREATFFIGHVKAF